MGVSDGFMVCVGNKSEAEANLQCRYGWVAGRFHWQRACGLIAQKEMKTMIASIRVISREALAACQRQWWRRLQKQSAAYVAAWFVYTARRRVGGLKWSKRKELWLARQNRGIASASAPVSYNYDRLPRGAVAFGVWLYYALFGETLSVSRSTLTLCFSGLCGFVVRNTFESANGGNLFPFVQSRRINELRADSGRHPRLVAAKSVRSPRQPGVARDNNLRAFRLNLLISAGYQTYRLIVTVPVPYTIVWRHTSFTRQ